MGKRGPAGEKKRWLAIARDDELRGSHILIVEAATHKAAYEECEHQCVMLKLGVPDRRAVYELKEDMGPHICTVLDAKMKEGLFNGLSPLSLGPGTASTKPWSGAVLR